MDYCHLTKKILSFKYVIQDIKNPSEAVQLAAQQIDKKMD